MRNNRLGILIIAGALLVIVALVALIFTYQLQAREADITASGTRLARTLSTLPAAQFGTDAQPGSTFHTLIGLEKTPEFAYGVLVDTGGRKLTQVTAPGVVIPDASFSSEPSTWFGSRTLASPADGRTIREFHAPSLEQGELKGFIRIGYHSPGFAVSGEQITFLGLVALAVFLLVPAFYLVLRRALRPLERLNTHLGALAEAGGGQGLQIAPTADLREFMDNFTAFVGHLQERSRVAEAQRDAMHTANRLLSFKKNKAETVLEVLPDGVMVMDDAGVITFASAKIDAIIAVSPEQVVGQTPQQWCRDEGLIDFLMRARNIASRAARGESLLYSPQHAPERNVQVYAIPLAPSGCDEQSFFGALLVFRDVTAETHSKEAGREFVAYATHEMKTPLGVLALYSEMLQDDKAVDETMRVKAVNAIHDQVERMNLILENLRTITMIETGTLVVDRQRVKLHDLLRDVFAAFEEGGRGAGLELELAVPNELTPVALDKGLFTVALNNLLSNAAKYNNPGGKIQLVATEDEQQIVIAVKDTGIGFAAEYQERIFDKFFRCEDEETRRREGQGLGLYLSRRIIELHQGRVSAVGEPGKGATFSIVLPKTAHLLRDRI